MTVDDCYDRSIDLLRRCATADGFLASASFDHYASVWARDAAIACLAANRLDDPGLRAAADATLRTLAERQAPSGAIPNAYWPASGHWDWGEAGAVDASAWFVITAADSVLRTGDAALARRLGNSMVWAFEWLQAQDPTNTGLVASPEAGDWMDSSLVRSGRVFHVNALYHWAALAMSRIGHDVDVADIGRRVQTLFWPDRNRSLDDLSDRETAMPHAASPSAFSAAAVGRRHFLSHVTHASFVDRCDVLANLIAIVTGLATGRQTAIILEFLDDVGAARPYPTRVWPEPATAASDPWRMWNHAAERHIPERWRNPPWSYHNAGIWPYVGATHALASSIAGRDDDAQEQLVGVAEANGRGAGFHEWLHGETGEPAGAADQVWNAGAYVLAYQAIRLGTDPGF